MAYEFTTDDFTKFSQDLISAGGDQATVTGLLADMQDTITKAVARDITNTEQLTKLTEENQRLKDGNMALFLRLGTETANQSGIQNQAPSEPVKKISDVLGGYFDALDKGGK